MRTLRVLGSLVVCGLAGLAIAKQPSRDVIPSVPDDAARVEERHVRPTAVTALRAWPDRSRAVATDIIAMYGEPDEVTDSMLIWYGNGDWKRTIVYREEVRHLFPKPHTDVLEQVVTYAVPPERMDDLARFDGSVYVDRTAGELSSKCDTEEANRLALNLATDIARGDLSAEQGRRMYADAVMAMLEGDTPRRMKRLQFESDGQAADPDETVIPAKFLREHPVPPRGTDGGVRGITAPEP